MIEVTLILLGILIVLATYRLEQALGMIHDELVALRKATEARR